MVDTMTQKTLSVSTDGTAGPYIMLPVSQLDDVVQLLDEHEVRHYVEEEAISINGAPETAVIDLGRGADVATIQAILDSVR